jgi:hypothetical protein
MFAQVAACLNISSSMKWFNKPSLKSYFENGIDALYDVYELFCIKYMHAPNSEDGDENAAAMHQQLTFEAENLFDDLISSITRENEPITMNSDVFKMKKVREIQVEVNL